ncbi:hypothetical protein NMG60_11018796 [Bertholletia excelsa]
MDNLIGLLRIRVRRGINLVGRDSVTSSDPYVTVSNGEQTVKTRVVKNSINPEWNDELTLPIKDINDPLVLSVYDKDTFTEDDKMGDAEIGIKPYTECLRKGLQDLSDNTTVERVQPNEKNCLARESSVIWNKGKMFQDMHLKLRNVEKGEVEIQIELIDLPGCKTVWI